MTDTPRRAAEPETPPSQTEGQQLPSVAPRADKNRDLLLQVLTTLAAFILAFLVGAVVMVLSDADVVSKYAYFFSRPSDALGASWDKISSAFGALLVGSVGSVRALSESTAQAAPLILAGLGVGLAFRSGLFNIGGQGQAIWGAVFAAWLGFSLKLPLPVHLLLVLVVAALAGALWGSIAGFLRAKTGAHEVIVTIMLNWIALKALLFCLNSSWLRAPGRNDPISPVVEWTATLPRIAGTRFHLGFGLALLAAVAVWWLMERTTLGFKLRAVGFTPDAAATNGMNTGRLTIIAMAFAGGLAGLGGAMMVTAPTLLTGMPTALSLGIVGTVGFDAITVALLGRSKPLGIVLAGLLFGALKAGALTMQAQAGTPAELIALIQALIVLFVAAPAFVQWLVPLRRSRVQQQAVAA